MRKILLAGAGAAALAGIPMLAAAQMPDTHEITVRLPNGAVEHIRYVGDIPPRVVLTPAPVTFASPFEMMERISAEMNRQMAAMFLGMPGLTAPVPGMAQSYRVAAPLPGSGVCMQSMRVTFAGNGQQPVVERHSEGDCGVAAGPSEPASAPAAPAPRPAVKTIEVKAGPGDLLQPKTAWRG